MAVVPPTEGGLTSTVGGESVTGLCRLPHQPDREGPRLCKHLGDSAVRDGAAWFVGRSQLPNTGTQPMSNRGNLGSELRHDVAASCCPSTTGSWPSCPERCSWVQRSWFLDDDVMQPRPPLACMKSQKLGN